MADSALRGIGSFAEGFGSTFFPTFLETQKRKRQEEERQKRLDQAVAAAQRFYPDADPKDIEAAIRLHLAGIPQGLKIIDSQVGAETRQQAFDELIEDVPDKLKGYLKNRWEITGGATGGGKADAAFHYQLQTEDEKQELAKDVDTQMHIYGKGGLYWNPKSAHKMTEQDAYHLSRYRKRFGVDAYNDVRDKMAGDQVDKWAAMEEELNYMEFGDLTTKHIRYLKEEKGYRDVNAIREVFHGMKEEKMSFRDYEFAKGTVENKYMHFMGVGYQRWSEWAKAKGAAKENSQFDFFNKNFDPADGHNPKRDLIISEWKDAMQGPALPGRIYELYDSVRLNRAGKSLNQIRKDIIRARRTGTGAFGLPAKYWVGLTNDEIDMIMERLD